MCLPVAVPAHPRILAGRRFLRISGNPTGVLRVFREIRFYLHKEFRDREIRLYLHKEFRAAEMGFSLQKEFHKKNHEKSMAYLKNFRAARANLLRIIILIG